MNDGSILEDFDGREDFDALARALDRVAPPPALRQRVLASAHARPRRARPWLLPTLAFASGVLVAWWLVPRDEPAAAPGPVASTPSIEVAPAVVATDACAPALGTGLAEVAAPCRVDLDALGVVVDVWATAQLAVRDRTLVLAEGSASFDVAPVGDRPPIEVDVGVGRVRVLGTRFEIQNVGERGHIDLVHGRVEFHADGGKVHVVQPGTRFSWDRRPRAPAEPEAEVEPEATPENSPTPPDPGPRRDAAPAARRPASAIDVSALLDEVARHRAAGGYDLARDLLRDAIDRIADEGTVEVLSFELGTVLELGATAEQACDHWRGHAARVPNGTSARRTASRRARLGCDETP
jgi:hypothetical protein